MALHSILAFLLFLKLITFIVKSDTEQQEEEEKPMLICHPSTSTPTTHTTF